MSVMYTDFEVDGCHQSAGDNNELVALNVVGQTLQTETVQHNYNIAEVHQFPRNSVKEFSEYSENSMTELRGNRGTSAILYAEHSH